MTRINEFGQPIGDEVPGWAPRPSVEPAILMGRHVRLEQLQPGHRDVLRGTFRNAMVYRGAQPRHDVVLHHR